MAHVVIHPRADEDLDEQARYIARSSLRSALRFYDAAEVSIQRLADNPNLGCACKLERPELADVRVWTIRKFRKHLIFFRPTTSGVEILRILYGSRDIERLFCE